MNNNKTPINNGLVILENNEENNKKRIQNDKLPELKDRTLEIQKNAKNSKNAKNAKNEDINNSNQVVPEKNEEKKNDLFDKFKEEEKIEKTKWGYKILENIYFIIFLVLLTIFALFGDDIRILTTTSDHPVLFNLLTIITIFVFSIELIITSLTRYRYFLSFMFFLDLLATIMLIFDITYISIKLFGNGQQSISKFTSTLKIAARAGRIIRVINLFKSAQNFQSLINKKTEQKNIDNLKKSITNQKKLKMLRTISKIIEDNKDKIQESFRHINDINSQENLKKLIDKTEKESENKILTESKVGKKLNELTIKRVILLILIILILIPMFSVNYFLKDSITSEKDVKYLDNLINNKIENSLYEKYLENLNKMYNEKNLEILQLKVSNGYKNINNKDLKNYRSDEYLEFSKNSTKLFLSLRYFIRFEAILNILKTLVATILLVIMAWFFNKDAQNLILIPIEGMIRKVNSMAINPTEALEGNEKNKELALTNETYQIEIAITKIASLLILGYGQAGSEIISTTLFNEGDLNPILPGNRKMAIFGFCDIRNFTDATEVLKKDVMVFVNRIAKIVHSVIDSFQGAANKNIGDAFLLVWKLEFHNEKIQEKLTDIHPNTRQMADLSILSFLKIIAQVSKSSELSEYSKNKELNKRIPNYRVKMGFGLHLGWAIEGAIGSEFKIDASYLSPNVNMASRLEAATKQFGQFLLISSELIKIATDNVKQICRQIDIVTVKGSVKPIGLYTIDCNIEKATIRTSNLREFGGRKKSKKKTLINSKNETSKKEMDKIVQGFMRGHLGPYGDSEIKEILDYDENFTELFNKGFEKYISGDWQESKKIFNEVLTLKNDTPTKVLLNHMSQTNFIKPNNWEGFRELTEK